MDEEEGKDISVPQAESSGTSGEGRSCGERVGLTPPQPAKKTPNDYIFGKLLGEGSFSSVYLAKEVKKGKEYAIKVCDKQHIIREKKAESIRREKEVLTILSANQNPAAPFFVHLYATFQDSQRLYFVVTFGHGGELLKYLHKVGSFDLTCCRFYTAEILQALRHLHTIGIVHRDLKPENILLNEHGHILITDFGSAKILKSSKENDSTGANDSQPSSDANSSSYSANNRTRSNSFVGTAQYVSPEVLQGRYSEVGPSADLWAFGCILFQLLSGMLPFQANNEFLIFQKILKLEYSFPTEFPPQGKDLVDKLLKTEPNERLGAMDSKLYESIQSHPFYDGTDFDGLWKQIPPVIGTGAMSPSALKSQHQIPDSYQPGFDPRVIAERVFRGEQADFAGEIDDDEDDSELGSTSDLVVSSVSDTMEKLNVTGDNSISSSGGSGTRTALLLPLNDVERKERLDEQIKSHPQANAAVKGNLILKQGLVNKKKGLFARRRLLFLTEGPHLYYCEPNTLNLKGEIPWSRQLRPEAKDFKTFFVHTPNRIYYLEDPSGFALDWVKSINEIHQYVYGDPVTTHTN